MKATIDQNGRLIITAENELELYAMKAWWKGWQKPEGEQESSIGLSYEICDPEPKEAEPR